MFRGFAPPRRGASPNTADHPTLSTSWRICSRIVIPSMSTPIIWRFFWKRWGEETRLFRSWSGLTRRDPPHWPGSTWIPSRIRSETTPGSPRCGIACLQLPSRQFNSIRRRCGKMGEGDQVPGGVLHREFSRSIKGLMHRRDHWRAFHGGQHGIEIVDFDE